jgi:CDGSH-type Zn-finger protein
MPGFLKRSAGAAPPAPVPDGVHDPAICAACPLYQANTCCLIEPGGPAEGKANTQPEPGLRTALGMYLEPGTYLWCSCGLSRDQPFCDGSHEGRCCEPVKFRITEACSVQLCGCKHTKTPPFCDNSHKKLP